MKKSGGRFVKQEGGYRAFIPESLPPTPPIEYSKQIQSILSEADRALGRLDGIITVLPNPNLFLAMFVKKEALLSSQIEGTQASLEGVLEFEAGMLPEENINEIKEVVNYVKALNYGVERLQDFPFSLRLIKEIHRILISGTRGKLKTPGEFRKSQNWIGPPGASLNEATYVPPPPDKILSFMSNLEKYFYSKDKNPPLIKSAVIHSQFETIHPFLDGNGRIGRLLIVFFLLWKKALKKPILYISFYFKKNRKEYYNKLMEVRNTGVWNSWLEFFLRGVIETAEEATETAREIIALKDGIIKKLYENSISSIYAVRIIDLLFEKPLISTSEISKKIKITKQTANTIINKFEKIGILKEITGKKRYKKFQFADYVNIIKKGTEI
jgi:Fic family protein